MTTNNTKDKSIAEYMAGADVRDNIQNTLADKTPQFIASVASLVSSNPALMECDKKSLLGACLIAATLDLPINPNLGLAFIVPYNTKNGKVAQFQMGYKGFIQLAQRSGQFKTINVTDVKEGEIERVDRLTGEISFNWHESDRNNYQTVGFVAYMELTNGFRKSLYMTNEELAQHANKYSAAFRSDRKTMNLWRDEFDVMAAKTVLKLLLSKYAPMSPAMQKAQEADQGIIDDGVTYIDNLPDDPELIAQEKEFARIESHIVNSQTVEELELCADALGESQDLIDLYNDKFERLTEAKEATNAKK